MADAVTGYSVRVEPAGVEFSVAAGETILVAAERQGRRLRYGCRHGRCSSCKYQILDGEVDQPDASIYSLSDAERDDWALVCCAYPVEDLVVHDDADPDPRARPMLTPQTHMATVEAVERIVGNLWRLRLRRPAELDFYAGQFVELQVPEAADDVWRPYSLSTPPERADSVELIVKQIPTGTFSGALSPQWVGRSLGIRGPFGDSYLRSGTEEVVAVATGSGIAPILSIVGHAAETGDRRRFRVFYGARQRAGLAALDGLEELAGGLDLDVIASLSQPAEGDDWFGPVGRVTPAVQRQVDDASTIDAYVCGHPDMCSSVLRLLEAKGIGDNNVFTDEFFAAVGD